MRLDQSPELAIPAKAGQPEPAWLAMFLMVLCVAIALRLTNHTASNPTPDERTYEHYAEEAVRGSIETPKMLVADYNSHPENWIYPTPIRVGYYYLIAAAMKCSGASARQSGVAVCSLFSILQFLFVAIIGLRFLDRWTVLVALALFSVCPMDLAIARRVWQDGVVGGATLMLFYCCMQASMNPGKKVWLALFWLVGAYYLLIKESTAPVYGFYSLWLTFTCWFRKCTFRHCVVIATGCVLTALFSFLAMALLSGGVPSLIAVLQHSKQAMPLNQYAIDSQNGPWYSTLLGWWILSPVSASLCLLWTGGWLLPGQPVRRVLALDEQQVRVVWPMVWLLVLVTGMATLPAHLKNLRYLSSIYGMSYLLSGLGLRYLLATCRMKFSPSAYRLAILAAAATIGVTMVMDFLTFDRLFLKSGLDDLAIIRVIDSAFKIPTGL